MANLSNINNVLRTGSTGIGINCDPEFTLDVERASASAVLSLNSVGGSGAEYLGGSGAEYLIFSGTDGSLTFNKRYVGDRLLIASGGDATFSGNVGIGAAPTDGNLHVKKAGINTGITNVLMNASFSEASGSLTGLTIGYRTDETTAVLAPRTATGNLAFYSYDGGWSESMRIKNNGNVGIGTDSPDAKLHIQGSSSEQKVLEISTAQSDGPYTAYKNTSSGIYW